MLFVRILNRYWHWLVLSVITVFLLFLPVLNLFFVDEFRWIGPATITGAVHGDWKYYEPRIREILDGHPFIGNPFSLEYNNELPPAFFFADWLSAIPQLLGLSLELGTIVNDIIWSLLFVFLAYGILRELGVSKIFSVIGAELSYIQVFDLMTATVSMQTIFPVFLFFLFSFLVWIKNGAAKKRMILLIIASVLSFYVYTYLWQIALVMFGLVGLYWLLIKDKDRIFNLIRILCYTFLFSAPLFALTYLQVTHPDYWDTMQRIGLIETRLPTAEVFYSGRWVALALLLWFAVFKWREELRMEPSYKLSLFFFAISGFSMLIVSASNVITGKDLELAQHIMRFIMAWMPLAFIGFLFFIKEYFARFKSLNLYKKIIIFVLCFIYLAAMFSYYKWFSYPVLHRQEIWQRIIDNQKLNAPLNWLENTEKNPVVIWADDSNSVTNGYITVLTKHYVLSGGALLQLMSSKEVEERYLVSNYFNNLNLEDIKNDFKLYAGIGNAVHPAKVHNRRVVLCNFFQFNLFGVNCGEKTDAISLKGEKYFVDLHNKYAKEIVPNIDEYLKKYHVAYFLKNIRNNEIRPEKLGAREVYSDENFVIYKFR